jgi:hypothetical protein
MSHPAHIKPSNKTIQPYSDTLAANSERHVGHERAVRSAFQTMLPDTAKLHDWLLVPEKRIRVGWQPRHPRQRPIRRIQPELPSLGG